MDETAKNYNPKANKDDNSCIYEQTTSVSNTTTSSEEESDDSSSLIGLLTLGSLGTLGYTLVKRKR